MIANTPKPPYYAVIFTSTLAGNYPEYATTADEMVALAAQQPGYLGIESAREELGITVSYWQDEASILAWKQQAEHTLAREKGRKIWYQAFKTRVCKVERDYGFEK